RLPPTEGQERTTWLSFWLIETRGIGETMTLLVAVLFPGLRSTSLAKTVAVSNKVFVKVVLAGFGRRVSTKFVPTPLARSGTATITTLLLRVKVEIDEPRKVIAESKTLETTIPVA